MLVMTSRNTPQHRARIIDDSYAVHSDTSAARSLTPLPNAFRRLHVEPTNTTCRLRHVMTDTKRFEGIDSEFKELMKEAINVPMAVDACGVEGRAEGLKSMMQRLEMCQKSLNEYLDMKKKVCLAMRVR